jgi:hypothetical protein
MSFTSPGYLSLRYKGIVATLTTECVLELQVKRNMSQVLLALTPSRSADSDSAVVQILQNLPEQCQNCSDNHPRRNQFFC